MFVPTGRDLTPDRKETLRAGIAALLDTSDVKTGEAGMAWSIPMSQSHLPAAKKSLIIPAKLQVIYCVLCNFNALYVEAGGM